MITGGCPVHSYTTPSGDVRCSACTPETPQPHKQIFMFDTGDNWTNDTALIVNITCKNPLLGKFTFYKASWFLKLQIFRFFQVSVQHPEPRPSLFPTYQTRWGETQIECFGYTDSKIGARKEPQAQISSFPPPRNSLSPCCPRSSLPKTSRVQCLTYVLLNGTAALEVQEMVDKESKLASLEAN